MVSAGGRVVVLTGEAQRVRRGGAGDVRGGAGSTERLVAVGPLCRAGSIGLVYNRAAVVMVVVEVAGAVADPVHVLGVQVTPDQCVGAVALKGKDCSSVYVPVVKELGRVRTGDAAQALAVAVVEVVARDPSLRRAGEAVREVEGERTRVLRGLVAVRVVAVVVGEGRCTGGPGYNALLVVRSDLSCRKRRRVDRELVDTAAKVVSRARTADL